MRSGVSPGSDEHVAVEVAERREPGREPRRPFRAAPAGSRSARPRAASRRARARVGGGTTRRAGRRERRAPPRPAQSTSRRPSSVEVLRARRAHPRSEPGGHDERCEGRGWGGRIRTSGHGTKTRCLTTWLRPRAGTDGAYLAASEDDVGEHDNGRRDDRDHEHGDNDEGDERNHDRQRLRDGRRPGDLARPLPAEPAPRKKWKAKIEGGEGERPVPPDHAGDDEDRLDERDQERDAAAGCRAASGSTGLPGAR